MFVFGYSLINDFPYDVGEKHSVGLAEFLNVELISIERLNFLLVDCGDSLAELLLEDVLAPVDVFSLSGDEFLDGCPCVSFLWKD